MHIFFDFLFIFFQIEDHTNIAIKAEMKKVKKEFKAVRKAEAKFVREQVLKDPWEEGPWDEESTASEESDHESIFLEEEDWELHISVQGVYMQSCDIREWHELMGTVPSRILHAAGINVDYRRRKKLVGGRDEVMEKEEETMELIEL